ncbi:MAG: alpha/beta hydrolase [Candidatus Saccharibacteria bacterium]
MPSIRARLLTFMMKNRHLFKGNQDKVDWSTYESVLMFRRQVEEGAAKFGKLPNGIEAQAVKIGDMYAEWITPVNAPKDKVMLYFHGGGYISGTCAAHRAIVAKFVKNSDVPALLFEYRLAPEHRYPAAVEDAVSAYRWLLGEGVLPENIVFIGDSAGGGLALATLLVARDQEMPLPSAVVAYSPVTDYTCSGETYQTNAKTCFAPNGTGPAFARHYAGEHDLKDPYISPLFGDLHALPPMLIYAGSHETLLSDATRYAEKAKSAGVNVTLNIGEGLFHCYPAMAPMFPEATQAMQEICQFVRKYVGKR